MKSLTLNIIQEYKLLESTMHEHLCKFFDDCLVSDGPIVKRFGKSAFGTDHFVRKGNYVVLIQDKWESTAPSIRDINHFIRSSQYISSKISQNVILCLFVSKIQMSTAGQTLLNEVNQEYSESKYFSITCSESINVLVNNVMQFLQPYLVRYGFNLEIGLTKQITLYPHQTTAVNLFREKFLHNHILKSAIGALPTGSGKTLIGLSCIGEFWKTYPTKSVLWITERKDVLQSQFDSSDNIMIAINSGLLPSFKSFSLLKWYNQRNNIGELNQYLEINKPIFLMTNIDSILYEEKYKFIQKDKFGLVIIDECHCAGAQTTFSMLSYISSQWNQLVGLLGFSATPVQPENKKFKKIASLFGDGININFLIRMSIIDAIDADIIVPPKFYWVETNLDKVIKHNDFIQNIQTEEYYMIVEYIEHVLTESSTKKAIAWAQTIENADQWKQILERCKNLVDKYPMLSQFKIFISHTGVSLKGHDNQMSQFMMYTNPCLLICVGRGKEGFDCPAIDTGINLDAVQKRSALMFIQETGRLVRKFRDKQRGLMMETFTFMDETKKIEQICNIILGYSLFLKQIDKNFVGSERINILVKTIKVNHVKKSITLTTPKGKEIEFNIMSTSLKKLDWENLPTTLIRKIEEHFFQNGIGYEAAKNIIRQHNIKTKDEYFILCQTEPLLPTDPEITFRGKFSWIDYLNIARNYYELEECKEKINYYLLKTPTLKNNYFDLSLICHALCQLDDKFPPHGLWVDYYADRNITSLHELITLSIRRKRNTILLF